MLLNDVIKENISKNGGALPFEQFMSLCLYTPGLGYYSGDNEIIGSLGDFITAPELSAHFGYCIANQIAKVYQNSFDVLEFGAGSGKLALDVLTRLQQLSALPDHYYILDLSGTLKARQQALLAAHPALFERCVWLNSLPSKPLKGVVLANEVLDAMPVTLFRVAGNHEIQKAHITENDNIFCCSWQKADANLTDKVRALGELPIGYQSELNESIDPWLSSLADVLQEGLALLIDYGFEASTYYHPDRNTGTLMCHYQHQSHPDPFINIGKQDITAHVDFSHVANAALNAGFEVTAYTNQAAFLITNGIADNSNHDSDLEQLKASQAIKILTMPHEMGELFKVMALTKGLDNISLGFEMFDKRNKL